MDYIKLRDLIETHPQWPSVTDAELLIWGSDPNGVTRDRTHIEVRSLYEVIDPGKFADTEGVVWWASHLNITGALEVTESDHVTPTALRSAFLSQLKAGNEASVLGLIPEQVSRFYNAELYGVRLGDIEYARSI